MFTSPQLNQTKNKVLEVILLCAVLAITAYIYIPGLQGGFTFDDYPNIVENKWLHIQEFTSHNLWKAAFSSDSGLLRRPFVMLSFAINYYFHGLNPFFYKLTNLFIHLFNCVLIYKLSQLLLATIKPEKYKNAHLCSSLLIALLWATHPINLSSVLYVVQRMNSLATSFILLGIILYLHGRSKLANQGSKNWIPILTCYLVCMPLAMSSKESGILLIPFTLVLELFITHKLKITSKNKWFLYTFFASCALIASISFAGLILSSDNRLLRAYKFREFTLHERLLTESRALIFYLRQILLPDLSNMTIYHDDFGISRNLFEPITTLVSCSVLALCTAIALIKRNWIYSFSLFFFYSAHLLESTIFPLELVFEHRNYLASFVVIFCLVYYLSKAVENYSLKFLGATAAIILALFYSYITYQRAFDWRSNFFQAYSEASNHPLSVRANFQLASILSDLSMNLGDDALKKQNLELADTYFDKTILANENNVSGIFGKISLYCGHKKNIPRELLQKLKSRLRQGEVPAGIANHISNIIDSRMKFNCDWDTQEMYSALLALRDNPKLSDDRLSAYWFGMAMFQNNVLQDTKTATISLRAAVSAEPGQLDYRLLLTRYLIEVGDFSSAQQELSSLQALDRLNVYQTEIEQAKKSLNGRQ